MAASPVALNATLRAIFQHSLDAIAVHRNGLHVLVNPAYVRLLRYDHAEQLVGTPVLGVIAPDERPRIGEIVDRRNRGEMVVSDYLSKGLRRDGSTFDLEVHASTFTLGADLYILAILRDVTERVATTNRLREDEERFRMLFERSPDPAWMIDGDRFVECNAAAIAMLGYADKALVMNVHPSQLSPEFQPCGEPSRRKAESMIACAREQGTHRFDWLHTRADGSEFTAEVTLTVVTVRGREVVYCVWRDISERRRIEGALLASEQRFRDFTFASADWIWEVDRRGHFTYVAGNIEGILGYKPEELLGRTPYDLMPPAEAERMRAVLREAVEQSKPFSDVWNVNLHKNGTLQFASTSGVPLFDAHGRAIGFRGIDRDVTALQERDERILKMAYHDALTGLPNRVLLEDRVSQALLTGRRSHKRTALLFLDLDRFKVVNDSLGHDVGDQLLAEMGVRLQSALRCGDTLARLGGDEFVVLLAEVEASEDVVRVAEKLIAEVSRPVVLQGYDFTIGVSIGAAIAPEDGEDFHSLLKGADTAMYRAKDEGKSTLRFFDSSMNARLVGHLHLEARLRKAIDNGDLELHYQPKMHLPSNRMSGAEALVRWRLDGEMIPPAQFIQVAEETGLINPLGDLVLAKALDQARAWKAAGLTPPRIAVNLSARQFGDRTLVERVLRMVAEAGAVPAELELELTESLMMEDLDRALVTLGRLNAEGFTITLDDFGTGYSSLGYLKHLPIHCLKIDQSFVRDIGVERRDEALVEAILAIGRSLGLDVVAEGVENEQQLAFLRAHDCQLFQGYLFSHPLEPAAFERMLARPDG